MKKIHWILIFLTILSIHLTGLVWKIDGLSVATKPILLPLLGFYFWQQTKDIRHRSIRVFLIAQLFSWVGDLLLMNGTNPSFFIWGLISFLIAQLAYSYFLFRIMRKEKIRFSWLLFIPVVIYYATLISWLQPYLGAMLAPVCVYGAVISMMLLLALHMVYMPAITAGRWFMSGALLFVASDSALAFNKFYQAFEGANLVTMITYGLAQLFLATGAVLYIKRERARHSLF